MAEPAVLLVTGVMAEPEALLVTAAMAEPEVLLVTGVMAEPEALLVTVVVAELVVLAGPTSAKASHARTTTTTAPTRASATRLMACAITRR